MPPPIRIDPENSPIDFLHSGNLEKSPWLRGRMGSFKVIPLGGPGTFDGSDGENLPR